MSDHMEGNPHVHEGPQVDPSRIRGRGSTSGKRGVMDDMPAPTPADKADSLIKHLASTGVISNYKYVDGNKHLDQVFKDLCELFIRYGDGSRND